MASSSFSRCPTAVTPISFGVSWVRLGQDRLFVYLILAECRLVFPRPRLRSQTTMSIARARNQWVRTSWFAEPMVSSRPR